jgi:hypothetical protein
MKYRKLGNTGLIVSEVPPTPPHIGSDTPDATRCDDENAARGRRSDARIPVANRSTRSRHRSDNSVSRYS